MPCGYACFAYLSHVFALNASVVANAEAGTFPQRDTILMRTAVTPTAGFSMHSTRTQLGVGYSPSFSYIKDSAKPTISGTQNQSSATFSQRFAGSFGHQITAQTTTSLTAAFVTGTFDAIGLRQQLLTTPNAGVPVTQGDFRSFSANGTLNHRVSRRFSFGFVTDTTFTDVDTKGDASSQGVQSTNAALLGNQFRTNLAVTPTYLLTSRLSLQLSGLAAYQYISHQPLLWLAATAGTGLAFNRTTTGNVNLGFVSISGFPGVDVPRSFKTLSATATGSLTRQLSQGRNGTGFTIQLSWAPYYDPIANRNRSRLLLGAAVTWKPARDWSIAPSIQGSAATDPPQDTTVSINGKLEKFPDTRISVGVPVTYAISKWSQLSFGFRANLPSPNLVQRYKLIDPDYTGFVAISLYPLVDRR
jgi:hypothetical protein